MNSTPAAPSSNGKRKDASEIIPIAEAQHPQSIRRAIRNVAELSKRAEIETALKNEMKDGVHYLATTKDGETRYSLLKPGAEYLLERLGLCARVQPSQIIPMVRDFERGYISITATCIVYAIDGDGRELPIAQLDGSCNSFEPRYRYIMADPACPLCGAMAIFKSKKDGEGFFCWKKKGGCGATFSANDKTITTQKVGRIENPDIMGSENSILKIAEKRALVATVLAATNMSKHFTQDLEDDLPYAKATATSTPANPGEDDPPKRNAASRPRPMQRPEQIGGEDSTSTTPKDSPMLTAAINRLLAISTDYKKAMALTTTPTAIANHTLVRVAQLQHIEPLRIDDAPIDMLNAAAKMLTDRLADGTSATPSN